MGNSIDVLENPDTTQDDLSSTISDSISDIDNDIYIEEMTGSKYIEEIATMLMLSKYLHVPMSRDEKETLMTSLVKKGFTKDKKTEKQRQITFLHIAYICIDHVHHLKSGFDYDITNPECNSFFITLFLILGTPDCISHRGTTQTHTIHDI